MSKEFLAAYEALRDNNYTRIYWAIADHPKMGLLKTALFQIVQDWCDSNKLKEKTGYYLFDEWWTSRSYQELSEEHPSLGSPRTIQRAMLEMEKDGLIISYQERKDKRKFYRVCKEAIGEFFMARQFDVTDVPVSNSSRQFDATDTSICRGGARQFDATFNRSINRSIKEIKEENKRDARARKIDRVTKLEPEPEPEQVEIELLFEEPQTSTPPSVNQKEKDLEHGAELAIRPNVPAAENDSQKALSPIAQEAKDFFRRFGKTPPLEMYEVWASEEIGAVLQTYRKSSRILNSSPNDINSEFVQYMTKTGESANGKGKKAPGLGFGSARIRKMESDPQQWAELAVHVAEWQTLKKAAEIGINASTVQEAEQSRQLIEAFDYRQIRFFGD